MSEKIPLDDASLVPPRRGWNCGGCVVVVIILAVLVGMVLPVIRFDTHNDSRRMQCGKNQSQLLGAMIAYATSEETSWPDPRGATGAWKLPRGPITTALDGAKYTAGAFELLAVSQGIPNSLFRCPSASVGGPSKTRKATLNGTDDVLWGWDPAAGVAVSYGFDWASPADPSRDRVILADRDPRNHKLAAMVTFGDAHVKMMKLMEVERGPGVLVTESGITASSKIGSAVQPGDDIYSTEGDVGDPLTPGEGDPLRAWVK